MLDLIIIGVVIVVLWVGCAMQQAFYASVELSIEMEKFLRRYETDPEFRKEVDRWRLLNPHWGGI